MFTLLLIIHIIVCLLIIFFVLLQAGRGAELGAAFGSVGQANSMHRVIRNQLAELANEQFATKMRILYGGSVNADNAEELLGQSEIDGALVGGASLKTDQFPGIITAAKG